MSKTEFLSPEGLRIDGRRPLEIRQFVGRMGIFDQADGSSFIEQGSTKAVCSVYGPHEATNRGDIQYDRCIINCEFSMATFSSGERRKRSKGDRKSRELKMLIQQTFQEAIVTNLYPRSQIDIFVQILQSDGGAKCAAINAVTLALIDAGIPIKDYVTSCSAGCIDDTPILDLNYIENTAGGPDFTVAVLPKTSEIVLCQMESRVHSDQLKPIMDLAIKGCEEIGRILQGIVQKRTEELAASIAV